VGNLNVEILGTKYRRPLHVDFGCRYRWRRRRYLWRHTLLTWRLIRLLRLVALLRCRIGWIRLRRFLWLIRLLLLWLICLLARRSAGLLRLVALLRLWLIRLLSSRLALGFGCFLGFACGFALFWSWLAFLIAFLMFEEYAKRT